MIKPRSIIFLIFICLLIVPVIATTTEYNTSAITHILIKPVVIASFTQDKYSGQIPLTVQFTNTSQYGTSLYWEYSTPQNSERVFFSSSPSPSYTFTTIGNYTIFLTATGGTGGYSSSNSTIGYVTATNTEYNTSATTIINIVDHLIANFTTNRTSGQAPMAVAFTDSSIYDMPIEWNWDFGDGALSTTQSPVHTYTAPGTFVANLTISNITNVLSSTKLATIKVNETVGADFVGAPLSGTVSTDVSFVDFSTGDGLYSWSWTFGDGGTSITRNPTHTYSTAGSFDVGLTVIGSDGSNSKTIPSYITMVGATDINPTSTYRFKPDANIIQNSTLYNRTIEMGNVSNATYALGSTLFDPASIQVKRVLVNTTTYSDIVLTSYSMNNSTGVVTFNTTRPGGFAPGAAFAPIIDIEMFYYRYHAGTTGAAWGSGSLINGTYRNTFPVTNLVDSPLTYEWVTHSNFTISNPAPTSGVTVVTLTPNDNNIVYADRFLWNFGDGTTFLDYNGTAVSHIYTGVGPVITPFSPSLTAYLSANTSVTNTTTKTNGIAPVYPADWVKANFTATPTAGSVGLAVIFTDLSEFGTTTGKIYNWSFGDPLFSVAPFSNTVGDVAHVYSALGTYTVNLTVTSDGGTDSEEKLNYIIISSKQDVTNLVYQAQLYRFIFQNLIGTPLAGLSVTVTPLDYTMPSEWTTTLIGMSPTVNIQNNVISGITGSDGSLGTPLLTPLGYRINITGTAHSGDIVDYSIVEYPPSQGTDILITLPTSVTGFTRITPTPAFITYNIYNQTISNTTQILSVNFNDPTGAANLTIVKVTNQSGYVLNTTTYSGTSATTVVNNFTYIEGVTSPPGDILSFGFSAYISTAGGWNNITETYDSNTGTSLTGSHTYDQWAAIIIIVLVSSAFTASTVYIGTIGVGLMGLFFYYTVKWFTPGVQGTVFISMCAFWICIGIIGFITKRGRGGF